MPRKSDTPKTDTAAEAPTNEVADRAAQADELADFLGASPAVAEFSAETVNRKKIWTITLTDPGAEAAGDGILYLETAPARAFAAGLKAGAATARPARKAGTPRKPNPYVEAIQRDGRVVAPIGDPSNPDEVKRIRNAVFFAAYALGLKGQFTVRRDGDTFVGEKTAA